MKPGALVSVFVAATFAGGQHTLAAEDRKALVQPVFQAISLGSIQPAGWFKDQLELEANGLAGNLFDFYRFVHDSEWIGGTWEYSPLDEASPYWFNGLVPLAFGLGDERIKSQVKYYMNYVLDHQQSDGWLGFEKTHETRGLWARCLLLLGLMQYAEADPAETDRIVDAMYRYIELAHSMLKNNFTGLITHGDDIFDTAGFGVGRTHEMHIPLQWLYENHPRNNSDELLMDTMDLMIQGGVVWGADWRKFWVDGVYPEIYPNPSYNLSWVFVHGVNQAEGLRYPLAIYRNTHNEALKEQTRTAVDLLSKYHKSLAGTIIADEYISDLSPVRGSELCISAEIMFSMSYIYQYLGDSNIADWVEQTAFNSFATEVSADWWSHQYVQQENQPWSRNLTQGDALWSDVNSYANVFGLEPNYPCCTVNHPQAYPKFLANSFVRTEDDGLAHVFLIPASLDTKVQGKAVHVEVKTNYPFSFELNYEISASTPIKFYVRVPDWASSLSILSWGGGRHSKLSPSSNGLHQVSVPAGDKTAFTVNFDAQPRVVHLANNTAAVYYGALLYSLAIEYNVTAHPPRRYYDETILAKNTTDPHTHDYAMVPTSVWNIAIDPTQIHVVPNSAADREDLTSPIWDLDAPPNELRVAAVKIDWPLDYDSPADPPRNPKILSKPFSAKFVPYGSAKLHMAQLPVVELSKVNLST